MQSRIKFEYLPNGNLQRAEFLDDKIYAGSVATTEYMLKMADADNPDNWLPTDLVYINFKRPDNIESSVAMVWRSDLGLWLCTTNGTEVNYNADELTYLQISFTCKRSRPLTPNTYSTRTSETLSVAVHPSGTFIPENIEASVAIDLQNQINGINSELGDLSAEIDGKLDKQVVETAGESYAYTSKKSYVGVLSQELTRISEYIIPDTLVQRDNSGNISVPAIPQEAQHAVGAEYVSNQFIENVYSKLGAPNGIATLDEGGKIPSGQLPAYVDDVLTFPTLADFPETGSDGIIYLAKDTNKQYRWNNDSESYIELYKGVELGETSETAYRGDRGKELYDFTSPAFESGENLQSKLNLKANKSELVQPWETGTVTANAFTADATANLNYILTNSQDVALTIINAYNGAHLLIEVHGAGLTLPPECKTDVSFDYVTAGDNEYYQYEFVYNGTVWRVTRNVYKTA